MTDIDITICGVHVFPLNFTWKVAGIFHFSFELCGKMIPKQIKASGFGGMKAVWGMKQTL